METTNGTTCPCRKAKCARHGQCAACREYHAKTGTAVYCERETKAARAARKSLDERRAARARR